MWLFCYQMTELEHVLCKKNNNNKKKRNSNQNKEANEKTEMSGRVQLWWLPKYPIILREQESNCRSVLRKDVVGLLCQQAVWAWGTENAGQGVSVMVGSSQKRQSRSGAGSWSLAGMVAGRTSCFLQWRGGLGLCGSCWSGMRTQVTTTCSRALNFNRHTFTVTSSYF